MEPDRVQRVVGTQSDRDDMSSNAGMVPERLGSTSVKVPDAAAFNLSILDWLVCPGCRGALAPVGVQPIVDGRLSCQSCGKSYEVLKGVPILLSDVSADDRFTGKNFAEQWRHFHEIGGLGEEFENNQVVDYFHPFDIRNLAGKHVLEAGCGYGRNLLAAKKYGAATVIGFDVGTAALLAKARGCDMVIGIIRNPP